MTLRGDAVEAAFMAQFANVALAALFVASAWAVGRSFSRRAGIVAGVLAASTPWIAYLSGIAYVETGMLAMGMCALACLLHCDWSGPHASRWALTAGLLAGFACGFKYTAVVLIAAPLAMVPLIETGLSRRALKHVTLFTLGAMITFAPWMIRNVVNTHNPVFPLAYSVFGAKSDTWDDELEARWQRAHGPTDAESSEKSITQTALDRTIRDKRIGWSLLVLAACGLAIRPNRRTWALVAMLAIQLAIWLMATHLFARFAVVMLIPLIALAGRAGSFSRTATWKIALCAVLIIGAGWNLYQLSALYYHHTHTPPEGQPINAYGQTIWFTGGQWPGTAANAAINELSPGNRVMLIGEARTFYLNRPCVYAVTFNHHPLALAARNDPSPAAIIDWLRANKITHLLVHWAEIHRLRSTYGMDPEINAALLQKLIKTGLTETAAFQFENAGSPYATLFKVSD